MPKPILLIDTNYLCRRAQHSTGTLSITDKRTGRRIPTGVVFGLFREIAAMTDYFRPRAMIFCFDSDGSGKSARAQIYDGYKFKRNHKTRTPEEQRFEDDYREQVKLLRESLLLEIGLGNIHQQLGYEADDLLASAAKGISGPKRIISSDHDLLQLIDGDTAVCSPRIGYHKPMDLVWFRTQYPKLWPSDWANVKAVMGCGTDEVPGVKGVGPVTAVKWASCQLDPDSVAGCAIAEGAKLIERNVRLVQLPFPGTKEITRFHSDRIDPKKWDAVCKRYGMRSLVGVI